MFYLGVILNDTNVVENSEFYYVQNCRYPECFLLFIRSLRNRTDHKFGVTQATFRS